MANISETTELVPVAEAAEAMETTQLNVMMHLKRRLLDGCEVDDAWFVKRQSLESYLTQHNSGERPMVCADKKCPSTGCGSCG